MMKPTKRFLDALEERGCDPKQSGKEWKAKCPAHSDKSREGLAALDALMKGKRVNQWTYRDAGGPPTSMDRQEKIGGTL